MDTTTYDRPTHQTPAYGGFEARLKPPTSIVVHSTSNPNHKNTAFSAEAKFLFASKLAGAHYLVGKDGAGVRFFEPRAWAAWHAGNARAEYLNQRSIGIELHHSVGDPPYPKAQIDALAELVGALSVQFGIHFGMVETHGQIAIKGPYDRKTDPSDWPHADFIRWRATLVQPAPEPFTRRYRVRRVMISQRSEGGPPYAGELAPGEEITADKWYATYGTVHLQDERGFVLLRDLETI